MVNRQRVRACVPAQQAAAMAADAPAAGQPDALKLHPEERAAFDAVSYDSIQAMRDLGTLQRLERYMRHEGACRRREGRRASRRVGSGEGVRGGSEGGARSLRGRRRAAQHRRGWLAACLRSSRVQRSARTLSLRVHSWGGCTERW